MLWDIFYGLTAAYLFGIWGSRMAASGSAEVETRPQLVRLGRFCLGAGLILIPIALLLEISTLAGAGAGMVVIGIRSLMQARRLT